MSYLHSTRSTLGRALACLLLAPALLLACSDDGGTSESTVGSSESEGSTAATTTDTTASTTDTTSSTTAATDTTSTTDATSSTTTDATTSTTTDATTSTATTDATTDATTSTTTDATTSTTTDATTTMGSTTGGGLGEGEVCQDDPNGCMAGLLCCYPCGVPDCQNKCIKPDPQTRECPLFP